MKGSSAPIKNTRRGKYPWRLDLRYVGGRREFFATEDQARTRREEVLRNVRKHGAAALKLPYEKLVRYVAAETDLKALGLTLDEALTFIRRHHRASDPILFSKAIEQFHAVKEKSRKDSEYVRKLRSSLLSLQRSAGDKLLSLVTRDEIEHWLFRDGWKQDTIRSHRINVRTFFNYALNRNWIATNPAAKLEPVERTNKPPGILTVEECENLLAHCPKYFLPYVVLNLLCGIRASECVLILAENISIEKGVVEVPAFRGDEPIAKSRKRRPVDLSGNAKAWLKLCDLEAMRPRSEKWFARQLPKARAAAKLPRWPKNCLRHSFASYHLAMHGSADRTATQMGHEDTKQLFEHYRAIVTRDEAERFWSIKPE